MLSDKQRDDIKIMLCDLDLVLDEISNYEDENDIDISDQENGGREFDRNTYSPIRQVIDYLDNILHER